MMITYGTCNTCGARLVKRQADLTNAGVEGFECPLKLESDRQEKRIDALDEAEDYFNSFDHLEREDRIERKIGSMLDGLRPASTVIIDPGFNLGGMAAPSPTQHYAEMARKIHQASQQRETGR